MMNTIICELNERGYCAEIKKISKNGVEKTGVIIGEGEVRPTIYIDDLLAENIALHEIVSKIIDIYENAPDIDFEVAEISSWEYAKKNLRLCLQKKTDEPILKRDYLDMEMYVRVNVSESGSYKIPSGMFKEISEDEIFARALLNTKKNIAVEDMYNLLVSMGCDEKEMEYMGIEPSKMLIVTNKERTHGASVICDKDFLSIIAKEYDSNLVILPSSIHECIICFDNAPDMELYNGMVREAYKTQVVPEEVLSNHAYFFNRLNCEVTW